VCKSYVINGVSNILSTHVPIRSAVGSSSSSSSSSSSLSSRIASCSDVVNSLVVIYLNGAEVGLRNAALVALSRICWVNSSYIGEVCYKYIYV
jgi:hypothetical protein